jgi:hypothetical protein
VVIEHARLVALHPLNELARAVRSRRQQRPARLDSIAVIAGMLQPLPSCDRSAADLGRQCGRTTTQTPAIARAARKATARDIPGTSSCRAAASMDDDPERE